MISETTPSFRRALALLAETERTAARRAYRLFQTNPQHNSLRFKRLYGHSNLWSVRVTRRIRAVGQRSGEVIKWVWIGSHDEFDKLFS